MSQDVKQKTKRERISTNQGDQVEVIQKGESQTQQKEAYWKENANVPMDEFDWDAHQAECPTMFRKPNPKINAPHGVKVFSREPYAQDMLNLLMGFEAAKPAQMEITEGGIYTGTVYSINQEFAAIDIGYRENVYVNMLKEEAGVKPLIVVNNEVKVQVLSKGNTRGYVLGSVSAGVKTAVVSDIMSSIEGGTTAYVGTISEMIPGGGYIVNIQGVDCFMPGSLAGINKLADFESIVGTDMYVVPVSFSTKRGTIVVSHREYLKAMIPNKVEALRESPDGERIGKVTGSAKYGVFVEFDDCLTGMIHVNDLTPEMLKKHKAREIQPGDDINFRIKEVVSDTKIILTQLETVPVIDPWEGIEQRIQVPSEVVGVVKAVKDYGIFIDVEPGIAGLLHISEIQDLIDTSTIKTGDNITVQVTRIDSATRKIFLKI